MTNISLAGPASWEGVEEAIGTLAKAEIGQIQSSLVRGSAYTA